MKEFKLSVENKKLYRQEIIVINTKVIYSLSKQMISGNDIEI